MRFSNQYIGALCLAGLHQVNGHYGFPFLVVDGVVSKRWEYVRPVTNFQPNSDLLGLDAMCGAGGATPLFPVKTLKIAAGSTIGFAASQVNWADHWNEHKFFGDFDPSFGIWHNGPATAYLSKAPDDVDSYTGNMDWFKIDAVGASNGMDWDIGTWAGKVVGIMNFTIPAATPPGKYLMRAEHMNMDNAWQKGFVELYVNCAQIEVTGSGAGTPKGFIRFPGAFDIEDPRIWLPASLHRPFKPMDELKNWEGPGPAVWRGD